MSPMLLEVQVQSLRRQLDRLELAIARDRTAQAPALADYQGVWAGQASATDADFDNVKFRLPDKWERE